MKKKEIEKLKELNKVFKKSSPAMKRVIIAQDVIAQLKAKKFIAIPGQYLKIVTKESEYSLEGYFRLKLDEEPTELQKIIQTPNIQCNVCAIGSCFSSLINIKDNFELNTNNSYEITDNENNNGMTEELEKYFSLEQLKMMEIAFECWDIPYYVINYFEQNDIEYLMNYSEKFGKKYKKANNRLIAIMQNIIKNNGEFVPF
jgi:hypothetical protein